MSGDGCVPCNCNVEGSYNSSCDAGSGKCYCKPGIGGYVFKTTTVNKS